VMSSLPELSERSPPLPNMAEAAAAAVAVCRAAAHSAVSTGGDGFSAVNFFVFYILSAYCKYFDVL